MDVIGRLHAPSAFTPPTEETSAGTVYSLQTLLPWVDHISTAIKVLCGFKWYFDKSVDWTTGVRFPVGAGIFLLATAPRPALGPTQPPIQWVPGVLSPGVKRPERETDHSLPPSADVKNAWSYTYTPQYVLKVVVLTQ